MTAFVSVTSAAAGCGGDGSDSKGGSSASPPTAASPSASTPAPQSPSPSPSKSAEPERFQSAVKKVSADDLPHSWHKGCPVSPSGLRMIEMTYWGMDHKPHAGGKLVVNAEAADKLVGVFHKLFEERYPIHRMEPVDVFKGSDFDSIEADNTSAFNCRNATGSSNWSQHAYGLAVDLNPCENPYVTASGHVEHKDCVKFADRSRKDPGVIHKGDKTVRAFASIDWGWGGSWDGTRDYQHFSSSGR
ncbi:M15 family metallopeptidase [Actinomadura barringtoniae]|uniref:M15 family metallopeptidase n=2 Tax=Actinomadura barringtoniae TaxID=1427535 RepID=A0A939T7I1_9ACTN|nr:M15 family metallopeptidase [Actinomadura barringtoniae]